MTSSKVLVCQDHTAVNAVGTWEDPIDKTRTEGRPGCIPDTSGGVEEHENARSHLDARPLHHLMLNQPSLPNSHVKNSFVVMKLQ